MKHQVITLPEHHEHYPICGNQSVARTASFVVVTIFSTSFRDGANRSGAL